MFILDTKQHEKKTACDVDDDDDDQHIQTCRKMQCSTFFLSTLTTARLHVMKNCIPAEHCHCEHVRMLMSC